MVEGKIAITERLRKEGRWEEASKFRDEARQRLRTDGKSKHEAAEEAWALMAQEFPTLASTTLDDEALTSLDDLDPEELATLADGLHTDLARDVLWVYANLENRRATVKDAPCLGAWSMLRWARGSQQRFFEQLLPKVILVRPSTLSEADLVAQEELSMQEMQQMLASLT